MARVFDDYLDDLIEIAHNIVMTNDIFLSNVRSNIIVSAVSTPLY